MLEIAIFLGQADTTENNSAGYPAGERHAIVVFLRQEKDASPNFAQAELEMASRGWRHIEFSKASHGFPCENIEKLNSMHPHAGASYEDALLHGFGAVVFADPIENAL